MDFFLLDSHLSSVSLGETPYRPQAFGNQVAEYTPPSGIYLTLHGRGADGRSVTVETALTEGLSLSFLLQLYDRSIWIRDFGILYFDFS